jgi:hypothetical protein
VSVRWWPGTVAAQPAPLQMRSSSAAFDEDRAKPIAQRILADPDVRHRLFPGVGHSVAVSVLLGPSLPPGGGRAGYYAGVNWLRS